MGRRRISVLRRPRPYVVNMTKAILFPVTPRPLSAGGSPSSWARSAILASSMSLYGDDQTGGGVYLRRALLFRFLEEHDRTAIRSAAGSSVLRDPSDRRKRGRERGHCRRLKSCLALALIAPVQFRRGLDGGQISRPQFKAVEQRFGGVRQHPDARGMTCIRCQKAASVPRSSQSGPLRRPDDERRDFASDRQLLPALLMRFGPVPSTAMGRLVDYTLYLNSGCSQLR